MFCLLLLSVTAGFAQSNNSQQITLASGSSLKLRANVSNVASYQWFVDKNIIQGAVNQDLIITKAGKYSVISFSLGGCVSDISDEMDVISSVQLSADVSVTKKSETRQVINNETFKYYLLVRNNGAADATNVELKDILPDNLVLESVETPAHGVTNYVASTKTISWQIPTLTNGNFLELVINVKALKTGKVVNSASVTSTESDPDPSNNTSTDTKDITGLIVPNVFTPNGDGKNDTFFIPSLASYSANELTIVNRWGSTVYEKNTYLNDWTAEGLVDGTYFYILKVKNSNSDWEVLKGYVTVIR
ncbi:gliding motility-associated C-terminal domain-containing protein [Pedobacter mucosus]|uniref:T9SS type B sorting domain-containing protein n=1 Tax=Pedobacter mucosus TaxID=2895286 RepID=UPI001EE4C605|nr:gliding motility-associated C-terminal domain-containing protein [Pedobacter mucosus]UKT64454.1 gliding motility-associated C-terminal domain-containing protein [Pedobacter mucosus]